MSSVLLTMIGSQCRNRNPPAVAFEYASPWKNDEKKTKNAAASSANAG